MELNFGCLIMKKNIISFILSITFFIFLSCKTTDIIPGSNRIKIQNIYNEYLNIANVYFDLEKFDKAIEYYTLAMDSKELYWACYYKLAQCYALTSKWTQSEEYYVVLQERDPANSSIKASLAYIKAMGGNVEESKKIYQELIHEHPENQLYLENYIAILFLEKNIAEVSVPLATLKDLFPDSKNISKFESQLDFLLNETNKTEENLVEEKK